MSSELPKETARSDLNKASKQSFFQRLCDPVRADYASFVNLVDLISEDYGASNRDATMPGFRAVFTHRLGNWGYALRFAPLRILVKILYKFLYVYIRNQYTIELPRTTKVGRRLNIAHQGGIVIHPLSTIGDDCIVLQNVTIGAATGETFENCPVLGNRVYVGCGAAIIGKVFIGDDVRIGPNVVVTMNVPAQSSVVSPPPRVIQFKRS